MLGKVLFLEYQMSRDYELEHIDESSSNYVRTPESSSELMHVGRGPKKDKRIPTTPACLYEIIFEGQQQKAV